MSTVPATKTAAQVAVGTPLPSAEKRFTTIDLVAYGAATWDWHRLHYDVEYARSLKLPNVIIDGQVFGALFAKQAIDFFGPRAFITKMGLKMRTMAFAGDTVRAEGEVREVRGDVVVLTQRLKLGDKIAAESTTEVRLPR